MNCYRCGRDIPDNSRFCPKCGCALVGFTEELIRAAQNGDQGAIAYLYNRTYNSVFQTAMGILRDEDAAMDMVQDTYVLAFRNLEKLGDPSKFGAWVKRICANTTKNYLKKKKPTLFSEMASQDDEAPELEFEDMVEANQPEVVLDKKETARLIGEILDSLSDDQRLVVTMYYFDEMSVRQIAQAIGCSENTVKSRLSYGRKKIEAQVLELEKRGTKLYSLAPLPFFLWLLRSLENAGTAADGATLVGIQQALTKAAPTANAAAASRQSATNAAPGSRPGTTNAAPASRQSATHTAPTSRQSATHTAPSSRPGTANTTPESWSSVTDTVTESWESGTDAATDLWESTVNTAKEPWQDIADAGDTARRSGGAGKHAAARKAGKKGGAFAASSSNAAKIGAAAGTAAKATGVGTKIAAAVIAALATGGIIGGTLYAVNHASEREPEPTAIVAQQDGQAEQGEPAQGELSQTEAMQPEQGEQPTVQEQPADTSGWRNMTDEDFPKLVQNGPDKASFLQIIANMPDEANIPAEGLPTEVHQDWDGPFGYIIYQGELLSAVYNKSEMKVTYFKVDEYFDAVGPYDCSNYLRVAHLEKREDGAYYLTSIEAPALTIEEVNWKEIYIKILKKLQDPSYRMMDTAPFGTITDAKYSCFDVTGDGIPEMVLTVDSQGTQNGLDMFATDFRVFSYSISEDGALYVCGSDSTQLWQTAGAGSMHSALYPSIDGNALLRYWLSGGTGKHGFEKFTLNSRGNISSQPVESIELPGLWTDEPNPLWNYAANPVWFSIHDLSPLEQ